MSRRSVKPSSDLSYGLFEFAARSAGFSQLGIMEQLLGPEAAARSARGYKALSGGPKVKKTPKTLKDLIDHNVRFLRGELPQSPNHLGPVDKETEPYLGPLIAINLVGPFLTTNSQPGLSRGRLRQRSYLTGLTPRRIAEKLHAEINAADLILTVHAVPTTSDEIARPHNATLSGAVTVTRDGKRDHTFVGHYCDDFSHWERLMPVAARRRIAEDLCEVTGIDPVWGRDPMHEKGLFKAFLNILGADKAS
jgi:hypothetical protein